MITAIFNKSKPINLVIASLILVLGFIVIQLLSADSLQFSHFFSKTGLVLVAVLSIFVVDFIVKKNMISDQNSYVILFYSLFFIYFWTVENDYNLILANLFVLLGLRKIISLKSQQNITKKLFDASLWICVASIFYFSSILFLIVLYVGILMYASNYYKNWLIPFVSIFIVFIIVNAYEYVLNNQFFQFSDAVFNLEFQPIYSIVNKLILSFFTIVLIVSLIFLPSSLRNKRKKIKWSYIVISIALFIAICIGVFTPSNNLSLLVFAYFPLASLFAVFFEKISKPWIQSIILYCMVLCSIIYCFMLL